MNPAYTGVNHSPIETLEVRPQTFRNISYIDTKRPHVTGTEIVRPCGLACPKLAEGNRRPLPCQFPKRSGNR